MIILRKNSCTHFRATRSLNASDKHKIRSLILHSFCLNARIATDNSMKKAHRKNAHWKNAHWKKARRKKAHTEKIPQDKKPTKKKAH